MDLLRLAILFTLHLCLTNACQTRYNRKSPVLELRPLPAQSGSTLIWLKTSVQESIRYWQNELDNFLKPYINRDVSENMETCNREMPPSKDKFCEVNIGSDFGPCTPKHGYGYHKGTPCIFLRLNEIPKGWTPQFYNSSVTPKEIPEYLKTHIKHNEVLGRYQTVWVSCDGVNAADKENIGPVSFYPEMGFPANYLLNSNVRGYRAPLVAVFFEKPQRGIVINIVCSVWAANIPRDLDQKIGSVQFVLLVD
ncbi:sodium/potassium-transporting ATPase subunit beta-2-like [Zophobas morio]|uniref:sodium/potassium-transporting ATPase subunit beta-2-like n=1 Tax=Zophobas morio TaxID=2755281 RepID=UPI003082D44D